MLHPGDRLARCARGHRPSVSAEVPAPPRPTIHELFGAVGAGEYDPSAHAHSDASTGAPHAAADEPIEAVPGGLAESFAHVGSGQVQRAGAGAGDAEQVHGTAREGVRGAGSTLPHLDTIQHAFGDHDVSGVRAHVGGDAAAACEGIGATAYATGQDVAFARQPDLHLAAHEAAHVIQQRVGVQLAGGVGQSGDPFEQHADAVADAVVRGESAEALLGAQAHGGASGGAAVQRDEGDLRLTMPNIGDSLRRPASPSLFAPGELALHLTPPSAADLLRPTDASLDALARSWVHHFSLGAGSPAADVSPATAPAAPASGPASGPARPPEGQTPPYLQPPPPPAPGDPLQQLLTAWRRLAGEWVARGVPGMMNPELAREELVGPASHAVPATYTAGDIPGKVWEAFRTALAATQFYPQLEARARELAGQHWPLIVIAAGTALGTAVTKGVVGNDWQAMATLSQRLTSFAHVDIALGSNVQLQLALQDSKALRPNEQGVVIGVSPSIGVRWQIGPTSTLTIRSQANLRFQTGLDTDLGFDWSVTPLNVQLAF